AIIARLRRVEHIGIVVIVNPSHVETRINALLIGADACLTTPVEPRELSALMFGVARRVNLGRGGNWRDSLQPLRQLPESPHAQLEEPTRLLNGSCWALCEDDWTLKAPGGLHMKLTRSERALMR